MESFIVGAAIMSLGTMITGWSFYSVTKNKPMFHIAWISTIFFIVCGSTHLLTAKSDTKPEPSYIMINLTAVSATDLGNVYSNNIVKADFVYTGKHCLVTGKVRNIGKDSYSGHVYILIQPEYLFRPDIKCYVQKDRIASVINIEKGNYISVEGICSGLFYGNVEMTNCQVVNEKEEVKQAKVKIKEEVKK